MEKNHVFIVEHLLKFAMIFKGYTGYYGPGIFYSTQANYVLCALFCTWQDI